jgi:hypothetical protein
MAPPTDVTSWWNVEKSDRRKHALLGAGGAVGAFGLGIAAYASGCDLDRVVRYVQPFALLALAVVLGLQLWSRAARRRATGREGPRPPT